MRPLSPGAYSFVILPVHLFEAPYGYPLLDFFYLFGCPLALVLFHILKFNLPQLYIRVLVICPLYNPGPRQSHQYRKTYRVRYWRLALAFSVRVLVGKPRLRVDCSPSRATYYRAIVSPKIQPFGSAYLQTPSWLITKTPCKIVIVGKPSAR